MNILSLFDGISCGMLALLRKNIPVTRYYASEIDKNCIQVASKHFPDIIHLGDVKNWQTWDIEQPDLIIGGSPCQGFSRVHNGLGFEDQRSVLFYDLADIISFYKPRYFLVENVNMKKQWCDIISDKLQVQPAKINSSLFSAQDRTRLYWTNIPIPPLPASNNLVLNDIINPGVHLERKLPLGTWKIVKDRYIQFDPFNKKHRSFSARISFLDRKGLVITKSNSKRYYVCDRAKFLRNPEDLSSIFILEPDELETLQTIPQGYTNILKRMPRGAAIGNAWTVDVISHIFGGIVYGNR